MAGVENPGNLSSRRVMLSVSASQYGRDVEPKTDEAVEQPLCHGPEIIMAPYNELREHGVGLDRGVQQALEKGLPKENAQNLREILSRHVDAFRRVLRGDPPAKMEPMKI